MVVARSTVFRFSIFASIVGSSCKIFAFEFDPVIDRRRMQFERNFFAGVQRRAAKTGDLANRMLELGRRGFGLQSLAP